VIPIVSIKPCRRQISHLAIWNQVALLFCLIGTGFAAETRGSEREAIRSSIKKSLSLLSSSADFSRGQRNCFTCHHVSFPALAANAAWRRGFEVDRTSLDAQLKRTHDELTSDIARFLGGRFPNGKGDQIGHSLWLLKDLGWEPDQTTTDSILFLLEHDKEFDAWKPETARPPTVGSPFTTTFVVLQAIEAYRQVGLGYEIRQRRPAAVAWVQRTPSFDNEDMVYRLRALHLIDNESAEYKAEAAKLLQAQREDGGWAQMAQLSSDVYATGTALSALADTGVLKADAPAYQKGVKFLLKNQLSDGSWHVRSRTQAQQPFYNSLFPHQKDQFISAAASAWATYALLQIFPETEARRTRSYLTAHPEVIAKISKAD
jgi:hypothetical protein